MIKSLFNLFGGGIYGYLIAAGISFALAVSGTYYIVHTANAVEISGLKLKAKTKELADVSASLEQLKGFIAGMHNADTNFNAALQGIDARFAALEKDWKRATGKPLPLDCKPDFERLRILKSATDATRQGTSTTP